MKLLTKYNRVNIPIMIAALLISGIGYYFILHYVLIFQLDNDLSIEKQEILHHIKESNSLPEVSNYKDQQIKFTLSNDKIIGDKFTTVESYDKNEGEEESFRKLDFQVSVNGNNYLATVRKSQQETEDIVRLILLITFSVIAFLLIILFIANRFLLSKLWQPFYNSLEQLKQFNLSQKNEINLPQSDIDEFSELNAAALVMTKKASSDYESLKSFSENASHEIQTPLSIILTKLELLLQSDNLDNSQVNAIQSLNNAATRLSKLNHSLLLLTKIENRQFVETGSVNISDILSRHVDNFEELTETKNIQIKINITDNQVVVMNESLAEILISNIMINAIKHNHTNGDIEINLTENGLTVSNTGNVPVTETSKLFERFRKDSTAADSLGLGLSIIKKICEISYFTVSYFYENNRHIIKVVFSQDRF
jgi:signal transduction histidine kinase